MASHDASSKDYLERIDFVTHRRLTHPEDRMPDNYKDFIKKAFATTKYMKTPNGEILQDIAVSNNRNIKDWPVYKEYFIYGEVLALTQTSFSESMYYVDIADSFERRYRFYIEKSTLESLVDIKTFKMTSRYIGGGFVYKKKESSTILSLSDFYMAKINHLGLIEGPKEKNNEK